MSALAGLAFLLLAAPTPLDQACGAGDINKCKQACKAGSVYGCVQEAKRQAIEGKPEEIAAASKTLANHCNAPRAKDKEARYNQALACGVLGSLVGAGIVDGKKDTARAKQLFERGCDGGDPLSCESLGGLYGGAQEGMKPDYKRALEWYEKGCALKNGRCCQMAGAIHADGAAGQRDNTKAAARFHTACNQDLATACGLLARFYAHGTGVKADAARATELNKKACRLGYTKACPQK